MTGFTKELADRIATVYENGKPLDFQNRDELMKLLIGKDAATLRKVAYAVNLALLWQRQTEWPDQYGLAPGVERPEVSTTEPTERPAVVGGSFGTGTAWMINRATKERARVPLVEVAEFEARGFVRGRN